MNTTTILEHHLELSEQVHQLLLEENTLLKQEGALPDSSFLERKRSLLDELSHSLDAVKNMRSTQSVFSDSEKEMIRTAQNRTMQGLYLDRENEQLLLKHSVSAPSPEMKRTVTEDRLKAAYGKKSGF
ncbi:MAG: hypothetical protein ACPGN3_03620 [Opitutales bacterium]